MNTNTNTKLASIINKEVPHNAISLYVGDVVLRADIKSETTLNTIVEFLNSQSLEWSERKMTSLERNKKPTIFAYTWNEQSRYTDEVDENGDKVLNRMQSYLDGENGEPIWLNHGYYIKADTTLTDTEGAKQTKTIIRTLAPCFNGIEYHYKILLTKEEVLEGKRERVWTWWTFKDSADAVNLDKLLKEIAKKAKGDLKKAVSLANEYRAKYDSEKKASHVGGYDLMDLLKK